MLWYLFLCHWSMCLFLCQYYIVFITIALYLEILNGIPPMLLFLLRIPLTTQSLFWFHMKFRIIYISVKDEMEILIGIALNP